MTAIKLLNTEECVAYVNTRRLALG